MCLSDKMIIGVGSKQAELINYLKSLNGQWIKTRDIMPVLYPHYLSISGNAIVSQFDKPLKCGLIERRVCETVNRFGRVDMQWYEYRYSNPEHHQIRTDEIEWEDGNPDSWIKIVKIDGKEVYRGKDW